jgi:antibiotic biosynthesis monooxygenase (ABM) superfamily enzyme
MVCTQSRASGNG